MSRFSEKVLKGEKPTEEDWAHHLMEAHHQAPSMTPRAYALYRTPEGITSYERLAQVIDHEGKKDAVVLDLACGDGYLIPSILTRLSPQGRVIGIDMSSTELAVAKRFVTDPRVSFHCAQAQSLPLPDGSVNIALCHLAFMLMLPIEPVVAELARVLQPGGCFSAIIPAPRKPGLYAELIQTSYQFIDARYPVRKEARVGDSRTQNQEGLQELFQPRTGFEGIEELAAFALDIRTTPEGVWNLMKDFYWIALLPSEEKVQLQQELVSLAKTHSDPTGEVHFEYPFQQFTVYKTKTPLSG